MIDRAVGLSRVFEVLSVKMTASQTLVHRVGVFEPPASRFSPLKQSGARMPAC